MNIVGPITYTPEELAFADKIMKKNGMEARHKWKIKPLEVKRRSFRRFN
jgi:hypothetical protein